LFVFLRLTVQPLAVILLMSLFGVFYKPIIPLADSITTRNLADPAIDYGRTRVFGSIGFVMVSLLIQIAGILTNPSATTIMIAHLVTGAAFLCSLILLPGRREEVERHPTHHSLRLQPAASDAGSIDPLFWVGILVIFTGRFAITAHYSFFSLFLRDQMGLKAISGIWAIGSLAEIPVILFGGFIIRKVGMEGLFAVSLLAISARLLCYSLSPPLSLLLVVQLLHAFTYGGFHMASVSLVNRFTTPSRRALGMALYVSLGVGASAFLASAIGGVILARTGFVVLFRIYAIIPVTGLLLLPTLRRRSRNPASAG
ncbi:MAG TPA: MFS transporter, partial [Spirochaetia bacterium]|nr:MFS transporter [Spirochaetia bacterium]